MSVDGSPASGSMPMIAQPSLIGEVLDGRYKIIKLLGEGGMGQVYAAEHVHIEKRYAIKLLRPEIVSNAEAVSRFRQEARSSSSIGHRNIIAIEDFGALPDGRIYMCMELLNGAALNDLITQPLGVDRLLNILIQTGHGLAAAHAKGIVHRDMKPENIFVTIGPNGEDIPKILDFGIAKVAGNEGGNHLTRTGTIFGTPFYMAPEQALGNPVDQRTDIYAMGVIAYEVFSGSLPFQGESFMGILTQHITTEPEPVAQRAAKAGRPLPLGLAEIVTRCMRKTPTERFGSMDELVNALIQVYRSIAGAGMSSYMEAFPHPSGGHNHPTPGPMMAPGQGQPGAMITSPNTPAQPMYAPQPGTGQMAPTPFPMQPGPAQPVHAFSASGSYDPAASALAPKKKSKVGLIVAILLVLGLGAAAAVYVVVFYNKPDGPGPGSGSGSQVASGSGSASGGSITSGGSGTASGGSAGSAGNAAGNHVGSSGSNAVAGNDPWAGSAHGGSGEGSGSGSQMVANNGSNGSDASSGSGSSGVGPGSNTLVTNGSGSGSAGVTIPPPEAPLEVAVMTKPFVDKLEIWEDGKKVDDDNLLSIAPKSPHNYVLKVKGYKDQPFTVDGVAKRVVVQLHALPGPKPVTPVTPITPIPNKIDCSQKLVSPRDATCRTQFCAKHPDEVMCLTEK